MTHPVPPEIFRRLAALKGVPPEAMAEMLAIIGELAEALEARRKSELEADEDRRAKHRDVMRRSRARQKATTPPASGQVGGLTGQVDRKGGGTYRPTGEVTVTSQRGHGDVGFPPKEKNQTPPSPSVEANASTAHAGASAADLKTELVWKTCPQRLVSLGLAERAARANIGRWLKQAGPDRVLEAVDAACRKGTGDPIPFIVAVLKPTPRCRRDPESPDRWLVPHGSEEYAAWKRHYKIENSSRVYRFADKPGTEVSVPARWPPSRSYAA